MRKVTASAVILTALTGCGQSSGLHSTKWSFDIPPEDELSLQSEPLFDEAAVNSANAGMMGPAYSQPGIGQPGTSASTNSRVFAAGRPGSRELSSLTHTKQSSNTAGYKSVPARPDPVAEVKAFLQSSGSPNALSSRTPYSPGPLLSVMPVDLPTPSRAIASTLGDPTDTEATAGQSYRPESTAIASLPTVVFSANAYSAANATEAAASYNPASYHSANLAVPDAQTTSTQTAYPSRATTDATTNTGTFEEGLPRLAPIDPADITSRLSRPPATSFEATEARATEAEAIGTVATNGTPIGTAILRDLQLAQANRSVQAESAQNLSQQQTVDRGAVDRGAVDTEIVPTTENANSAIADELATVINDGLATASIPMTATPVSSPRSDFPTLERLLETMPETAARPSIEANLPEDSGISSLLEGLSNTAPLSTLYLPIPVTVSEENTGQLVQAAAEVSLLGSASEVSSIAALIGKTALQGSSTGVADSETDLQASSNEANSSNNETLLRSLRQQNGSMASEVATFRSSRNNAILSLLDKQSAKRRQLVTWQ